jgi:hypothetical protein
MATSPHAAYDAQRNKRGLVEKMNGQNVEGDDFDLNESDNTHSTYQALRPSEEL